METIPQAEIMSGLNEQQRQQIRSLGRIDDYEQNAVICTQGDDSRKLYLVEEGQVAVEPEYGRGMRIPISIVSPGQAFGWSALVPPYRLTATVVALSKTRVISIERDALLSLMRAEPSLGVTIMQNVASVIASRLQNLELELVGLIQKSRR
jgi:CRP-like cAMP-binding protein